MTQEYDYIADSLEEYGTNRANFDHVSQAGRELVAKELHLAKVQVDCDDSPMFGHRDNSFIDTLIEKKCRYFHACGEVGISMMEAKAIWWSAVYNNPSPHKRDKLV